MAHVRANHVLLAINLTRNWGRKLVAIATEFGNFAGLRQAGS